MHASKPPAHVATLTYMFIHNWIVCIPCAQNTQQCSVLYNNSSCHCALFKGELQERLEVYLNILKLCVLLHAVLQPDQHPRGIMDVGCFNMCGWQNLDRKPAVVVLKKPIRRKIWVALLLQFFCFECVNVAPVHSKPSVVISIPSSSRVASTGCE